MLTKTRMLWCFILAAAAMPGVARAQHGDDELIGGNWNVFLHIGGAQSGRFLLQRTTVSGGGTAERELRGDGSGEYGGSIGFDFMKHVGMRLGYSYSSMDLQFRTDNGDGSTLLDADSIGKIRSHVASLEVMRYMVHAFAGLSPYATAGVAGAWWSLDTPSNIIASGTNSTEFRVGPIVMVGVQWNVTTHFGARVEFGSASVNNPFTGNESFRVLNGTTIDEPSRVSRTALRFGLGYNFGKSDDERHASRD